jgi:UDP-N-acetylglucosamine acyltransferase
MNYISPDAKIGINNYFGPGVFIGPNVEIGDNNNFVCFSSVGTSAEHKDFFHKLGKVKIGNNNIVREFVTINAGTTEPTIVGDNCILLRGCHVSHDTVLEDNVTVSCNVMIGGESYVMKHANLGLGCVIHQRQVIGSYSMIGMGAVITKHLPVLPGGVFVGNPAKFKKTNFRLLDKLKITNDILSNELDRYHARFSRV